VTQFHTTQDFYKYSPRDFYFSKRIKKFVLYVTQLQKNIILLLLLFLFIYLSTLTETYSYLSSFKCFPLPNLLSKSYVEQSIKYLTSLPRS